jgi:hypothetical protein
MCACTCLAMPTLLVLSAMTSDLPQLIESLGASDESARREAAEKLSRLGPDAQPAAVPLVRACGDQSEDVSEWAVAALEEMGPPRASDVGELASLVGDPSADVAYWAVTLLGRLEGEAAPAVGTLAAAVSDAREMSVRQRAAWALGKIGPAAREAADALRRAESGDDPRLARLARQAVERIRP